MQIEFQIFFPEKNAQIKITCSPEERAYRKLIKANKH